MEIALLAVVAVLALAAAAGAWRRVTPRADPDAAARAEASERRVVEAIARAQAAIADAQGTLRSDVGDRILGVEKASGDLRAALLEAGSAQAKAAAEEAAKLQQSVAQRLDLLRTANEAKLDSIRATVEEKLQKTLETRLGESFRAVSERLEAVHKGLGEMHELATGVGDLKRVLTNVKSRGVFGEVQLGALLDEVLVPAQIERNVETRPGSGERVEFAVRLPGRGDDGAPVLLPIDAKFPVEDYQRLVGALDSGDVEAAEKSRNALRQKLLEEAKKIRQKYVDPPATTDFALLYVPTEGLHAEALRIPDLVDRMQREHRVVLTGPTTLYAMLNSLQMGFRTLAIQKRSGEVWRILGAVKTEFGKFAAALDDVRKKIEDAGKKMDDTSKRTRQMERRLREVEALPEPDARALLPDGAGDPLDDEG